jgi:ATP-dependent Zn protease
VSQQRPDRDEPVSSGSSPDWKKNNRRLNRQKKERVAYDEVGHALVAMNVSGADPVQKIPIIPRGVATLGYTTEDRFLMIKSERNSHRRAARRPRRRGTHIQ